MKRFLQVVGWAVLALVALGLGLFVWLRASLPDCVVADVAVVLSERAYQGKTYSVWLVTSGAHDKTRAVYLYEEPVKEDACGRRDRPELTVEFIDDSEESRNIDKVVVRSLRRLEVALGRDAEQADEIPVQWLLGK